MTRLRAVLISTTVLGWAVWPSGCADDSPSEALLRKCSGAANSCFEDTGMLGTWECDLGETTVIEIADNGRWSQSNGLGQVGAGCINCNGDYEVVNTGESRSSYPRFAAFGTFVVDGDSAVWRNQHCLHNNLKDCRSEPAASGNATCERQEE